VLLRTGRLLVALYFWNTLDSVNENFSEILNRRSPIVVRVADSEYITLFALWEYSTRKRRVHNHASLNPGQYFRLPNLVSKKREEPIGQIPGYDQAGMAEVQGWLQITFGLH
jgi:hypothetical protein